MKRKKVMDLRDLRQVYTRFQEVGGFHLAASISFYALMSMIPLLFIIINVLGYLIGTHRDLHEAVVGYLKAVYPLMGKTLTREVDRVAASPDLSWFGVVLFLWLGSLVFSSLEYSINTIFRTKERRHFIVTTSMSFGMVMLSGLFMAVSFWASYVPKFLASHSGYVAQTKAVVFLTHSVLLRVLPLVMVFLSFTLIYKMLPNRRVRLRLAAAGGIIAATLWEIAKLAFVWYITGVADPGVYGSLSAIVVFLLWVFYSAVILLFVAELVCLLEKGEIA